MRRMKEMAKFQPGMSFYGEMPDMYNMTLNTDHALIKQLAEKAEKALHKELTDIDADLAATEKVIAALRDLGKDGKEIPEDKKKELEEQNDHAAALREKKQALIGDYAKKQDVAQQLVDIALLGNGLLKGEALTNFLNRSISLLS